MVKQHDTLTLGTDPIGRLLTQYAIPAIIVFIYLKGYYDLFSPLGLRYLLPWMIIAVAFLVLIFWITSQRKSGTHEG